MIAWFTIPTWLLLIDVHPHFNLRVPDPLYFDSSMENCLFHRWFTIPLSLSASPSQEISSQDDLLYNTVISYSYATNYQRIGPFAKRCRPETSSMSVLGGSRSWGSLFFGPLYWHFWLVGGWPTPLKNMKVRLDHDGSSSQLLGKNKNHVPNHQPVGISMTRH